MTTGPVSGGTRGDAAGVGEPTTPGAWTGGDGHGEAAAPLPATARWMFARDFAVVPRPYEEVTAALRVSGGAVVVAAVDAARVEGERLRGQVGPAAWPAVLASSVAVRVRPLRPTAEGVVLDFDGDDGGRPALLQRFEGDLDAAPFGSGETQVAVRWRYQPAGDSLLRRADEPLVQRIVEAALRALLRSACAALG